MNEIRTSDLAMLHLRTKVSEWFKQLMNRLGQMSLIVMKVKDYVGYMYSALTLCGLQRLINLIVHRGPFSGRPYSCSGTWARLQPSPSTRELCEQALVVLGHLRTSKLRKNRVQSVSQLRDGKHNIAEQALQNIRCSGVHGLECEAHGVVALKKRLSVENTTGQIGNVDASEGVGLASVASDDGHVWKCLQRTYGVECEGENAVIVTGLAAVPLVQASALGNVR